jgi:hypothetical protein
MKPHALVLALALLAPLPARASTIPDAGLRAHELAVTAGILDASVDWAVLDRLQIGAGGYGSLVGAGTYGRLTYRLLEDTPLGDVGFHVAGGSFSGILAKVEPGLFVFAGPVLARPVGDRVVIRASLGLIATNSHAVTYAPGSMPLSGNVLARSWGLGLDDYVSLPFIPNLEVAFRLGGHHELTLGGNAIVGWRARF